MIEKMLYYGELNYLNYFIRKSKVKTGSIPEDVKDPKHVSYVQEKYAKEAIFWLLSKTPHSIQEVSNHFGISKELTEHLVDELIKEQLVVKLFSCPTRYKRC